MKIKEVASYKKVTIVGDTSSFHLGSRTNYVAFRKIVANKYHIVQEIPYNAFSKNFLSYKRFLAFLRKSQWWPGLLKSNIIIVHGEGLTEKYADYVYHYLYFSRVAEEIGVTSHLVNFSMFEAEPFIDLIRKFDYVASREVLTQKHLASYGIESELSFDCSILDFNIEEHTPSDGHVAAIRGRTTIEKRTLQTVGNHKKYNCCWLWSGKGAVSLPSFKRYVQEIKSARFSLTTSFHGAVISYLSGIPFVFICKDNPKYHALEIELLPNEGKNMKFRNRNLWSDENNRKKVYDHFIAKYPALRKRALLNCI